MEGLMFYFIDIRNLHPQIENNLLSIISNRKTPREGITIPDLKEEYVKLTNEEFPMECNSYVLTEFILTIPHVAAYCGEDGDLYFYMP